MNNVPQFADHQLQALSLILTYCGQFGNVSVPAEDLLHALEEIQGLTASVNFAIEGIKSKNTVIKAGIESEAKLHAEIIAIRSALAEIRLKLQTFSKPGTNMFLDLVDMRDLISRALGEEA